MKQIKYEVTTPPPMPDVMEWCQQQVDEVMREAADDIDVYVSCDGEHGDVLTVTCALWDVECDDGNIDIKTIEMPLAEMCERAAIHGYDRDDIASQLEAIAAKIRAGA
jgi:hypothetical protein